MIPLAAKVALLGALSSVAAGAGGYALGRMQGAAAERDRQALDGYRAFAQAVQQAGRVLESVRAIGVRLAGELEQSREQERAGVRIVREVISANPEFAAVRRPAELDRLRRESLEAVARAAAQTD